MQAEPVQAPAGAAFPPEMLQSLFGSMPQGMVYGRMEYAAGAPVAFTLLYANAAFGVLSGQTLAEGHRFQALLQDAQTADADLLAALHRVAQQNAATTFERFVAPLNKWLQIAAHSPNPGHFILMLSDISSKRRAETEVAASEKRLRAIFEICPVPFCLNDTLGNITFLNRAFQRTFGYTVEDIPTLEAWWPRAYPDPTYRAAVGENWLARLEKTRRDGSAFETMEVRIRCKDGSERIVLAEAVPLGNAFSNIHLVVLYDITDARNAAQSLAKAERYAQRILDSVGDGLCQVDANGQVVFLNPRGAELLGYCPKEVIGWEAQKLFQHPLTQGPLAPRQEARAYPNGEQDHTVSVEDALFQRKNGSRFVAHYTSAPMVVDGEVQGKVLTFRDTSEEQRIRKALIDNEIVMRKAQETAGFGTYVLDLRSGRWESSEQLDAIFGIGADFVRDVTGWVGLVDPDFQQHAMDHLHLVSKGLMDFRLDYRIIRPSDGARRWVAGNGEIERDARGSPLRLIGSIQDITPRKQIEAELQESHDLLRLLSQEIPGVLYQFRMQPDGRFSAPFMSEGARELFGIAPEDLREDASMMFSNVVPEAAEAFMASVLHSAQTLENWVEEFQVDLPGRGRRWCHGQARPERLHDGSVVWHGFISDVTERVESRQQLQQLNETLESRVTERTRELAVALDSAELAKRSRGQFLANVSHEIRTPMNAIMGMVYLALKNDPNPLQREYLEKIQQSGAHLLSIINDILDFSKIDAGKLQLDLQTCDVPQMLQQVVQLGEGKAAEKGLRLRLEIAPDVPRFIRCDALRLGQVLINFLNNASKFTERGHIILRVKVLDRLHTGGERFLLGFEVEDTGIGIGDDQLARLFQSFEQGDNSTTRKFGGTGLGLAISRQLAYLMGGEVGAVSTLGVGSTFWLVCGFDAVAEHPTHTADTEGSDPTLDLLRGRRVLVVDDNAFNLEVAGDLLRDVEVQVDTASNGAQAVYALQTAAYDAVLMDIQMPVMDGHEATRRIRADADLADTVVIAMTANAGPDDRALCLQAGMNEVLTKPINPEQLFATLARWFSAPGAAPVSATPSGFGALSAAAPLAPVLDFHDTDDSVPIWDAYALQHIVGDNPVTQARLIEKYLQSAREIVTALRKAAQAAQWPAVAELGHKLKSSSRSVGALRLGELCEALEREGRTGNGGTCQALVALVSQGLVEVEARIKAHTA